MPAPKLPYPPSIDLAQRPTPLQPLARLSARTDRKILCKRDDLTGSALSGNKVRKLEFLLREALDQGAGSVITTGGEQSNHARATALAACQVGLRCHLLLRTAAPATPPPDEANILLDRLAGARVGWISPEQYARRDALMAEEAARVEAASGAPCYVIPEGGSNALGAWGYVRCVEEIAAELGRVETTIICATGSGGTVAGLIAGCKLLHLPYRVVGVAVCDDRAYFQQRISGILARMAQAYQVNVATPPEGIEIWQQYVGLGYAISRDEELVRIRDLCRDEGLITDPVYSGKALHGMLSELEVGTDLPQPIIFLHTGGIYGLFPKAGQLAPLL